MNTKQTDIISEHQIYNSYHTEISIFASLGGDYSIVKDAIPKSTFYNWKNKSFTEYLYLDNVENIAHSIQLAKKLINDKNAAKMFQICLTVSETFKSFFDSTKKFKDFLNQGKTKIVSTIDEIKTDITLDKAVKLFGITKYQYYTWKLDPLCFESLFNKCVNRYPKQLLKSEVKKIRKQLFETGKKHWPTISHYWYCIAQNIVFCHVSTFYKYAKALGFKGRKGKFKKKYKEGIRAVRPNQIWHADITIFKTTDGIKNYIYFIVDNYSRMILNWKIATKVSGKIAIENFKEAYAKHSPLTLEKLESYMTDGGSENKPFSEHLKSKNVEHLIANTPDVKFSNSIIEAINKVMKYQYLFPKEPENTEKLLKIMPLAIDEYNKIRPHGSLDGLTPEESFFGKKQDYGSIKKKTKEAMTKRIEGNRKIKCENHPN